MIRPLYFRLVSLYALLSALVLGIALGTGGFWEIRESVTADQESLSQALDTLTTHMAGNRILEDSWLAQQEEWFDCLFYLEDGEVPLVHSRQNGASDLLTGELLERCKTLTAGQKEIFTFLSPQGDQWRCAVLAAVPANLRQSPQLVLALRSTSSLHAQITRTAIKYLGLWAVGVVLLTLAGAVLAKTALKPTAEALRQQNEFVAAASHEFRTPLTVISSSLQAVQDQPQRRDKLIAVARGEVERLHRLTEELLFLAGQDARILRICPKEVEPDTLLMELLEAWQAPVHQAGCQLTLSLPQEPVTAILADRQRLEQLFAILLHNAMEYAPAGSSIGLSLEQTGKNLIFRVQDHGPGVPVKDRQRIFRRFVRGEASRTGKEHFGLGLSIASQIAQLHGGKLWVEDTPGGGATFCLRLSASRHPFPAKLTSKE